MAVGAVRPLRPVAIAGGGGGRGGVAIPGRGSGRTRVEDLVASLVSRPLKPSSPLRAARGPEETMGAAVTRDRCALLSLRALPSDWRRPYNTATRSTPVGEGLLCSPPLRGLLCSQPLRGFLNHHALNILWPSILRAPQYAKSTAPTVRGPERTTLWGESARASGFCSRSSPIRRRHDGRDFHRSPAR